VRSTYDYTTGVPRSQENIPPQDPSAGLLLWSYGGPRERARRLIALSYATTRPITQLRRAACEPIHRGGPPWRVAMVLRRSYGGSSQVDHSQLCDFLLRRQAQARCVRTYPPKRPALAKGGAQGGEC